MQLMLFQYVYQPQKWIDSFELYKTINNLKRQKYLQVKDT